MSTSNFLLLLLPLLPLFILVAICSATSYSNKDSSPNENNQRSKKLSLFKPDPNSNSNSNSKKKTTQWGESTLDLTSDAFRIKVQEILKRVWSCMERNSVLVKSRNITKETWPKSLPSDVEVHYQDLLAKTAAFRNIKPHSAAGYSGPWIENLFIDRFITRPLASFSGLIPLFVQWTDIHVHSLTIRSSIKYKMASSIPDYSKLPDLIASLLRDDVIYVMVNQDDQGITSRLAAMKPNILVLSAGGYGNVPIPLIKGELPYHPIVASPTAPPNARFQFSHELSFFGNARKQLARGKMLATVSKCAEQSGLRFDNELHVEDYAKEISNSKFNLAPRGFGRTSYRLAEIIQLGRVPIYLYDDESWLPYEGSPASVVSIGYSASAQEICSLLKDIKSDQIKDKLVKVHKYRSLYSYEGLLEQIELFLSDPFGPTGGLLRCKRLPDFDH